MPSGVSVSSAPISSRTIFPLRMSEASSLIARKPTAVHPTADRDSVNRCPTMPSPTSRAVTRLMTSEISTAAGRPMASAMRLERRSSASSMPKSLRRCMPSMRYTPNSCRRRAS